MDNEEERKVRASRSRAPSPLTELNQVSSDFVMAMALQEQETLATIESESSSNEDYDDDDDGGSYDYFESHNVFDATDPLRFLEGQDSNFSDDDEFMDEDGLELDVDELTYEELIALGELIGQEKRGLSLTEISNCLHACNRPSTVNVGDDRNNKSSGSVDRCVICQVEYEEGESIVKLIPCEHPYHSECITGWLQVKKICPICSIEVSPPPPKTSNNLFTSKL